MKKIDLLKEQLERTLERHGKNSLSAKELRRQIRAEEYSEATGLYTSRAIYMGRPME
jgi:hypothetical protein